MAHVTYEPSSRLKKSRQAVLLITGADLVLVKMTKATSTASQSVAGSEGISSSSSAGDAAAAAAAAAAAEGEEEDARASVLAQHDLNKVGGTVPDHVCYFIQGDLMVHAAWSLCG